MATELIRGVVNLPSRHTGCVMTIGNFDGVHIGHQALLARTKECAAAMWLPSLAMTFEPLSKEFFGRATAVPRLTRWREKFYFLSHYGIDKVFVARFNSKFAQLSAEDFVKSILCTGLKAKHIVVGDDFKFGCAREGDFTFLKQAGERYGFTVETIPSVKFNQQRVSSTGVRKALAVGDIQLAEKLLGRSYTMHGRVVHGNQRGRIIGFPTANIYLHRAVTPVQGVFIVRMHGIEDKGLPGVANVGIRPTVGGTRSLLEVHLFNFNRDIYGQHVQVEFCEKLRDEKRFENLELLKEQIWKDAELAKDYFIKREEL